MKAKNILFKPLIVLVISFCIAFLPEALALAQYDETEADVHIKVEATLDSAEKIAAGEAIWHNYSGTEFSGEETITAEPGDKIYIRTKIWNTATTYTAKNISGTSQITNSSYTTTALENADPDGNSPGPDPIAFNPYFFVGDGNGAIAEAYVYGSESDDGISEYGANCEGLLTSMTLASAFPDGQTVIIAQATITNHTDELVGEVGLLDNFGQAYAQEANRSSAIRIAVGEPLTTTITSTPSINPTATVLPETGANNDGRNNSLIIVSLSSIAMLSLGYSFRKRLLTKK